jgi:deazaflavin-dependent oxidoreductase (nitroreductase family)
MAEIFDDRENGWRIDERRTPAMTSYQASSNLAETSDLEARSDLAARLARLADYQTLKLTHYGRRSGLPYEVTIWFAVEDDAVYLVTADVERQWPRNLLARQQVSLVIGGEAFTGEAQPIFDVADRMHVFGLIENKYWYARPWLWLGRILLSVGLLIDRTGAFRVKLDADSVPPELEDY